MRDINKHLQIQPERIVPLVGMDSLPHGFRFKVNMYQFGRMRCYVGIPVPCFLELMDALVGGHCPHLIHDAIHSQVHQQQINFPYFSEDELPVILEVCSRYECIWQHFDD